jgi:hypothetical protein
MIRQLSSAARTRATLVLLASVAAAPTLRAQGEPATIPTVLASALLSGFGQMTEGSPRFVVDRAPPGWPAALVPPASGGARIIGGVSVGRMRTTVYRYPRSVDPIASYEPVVRRAGLKHFGLGSSEGGFESERSSEPMVYCGELGTLGMALVDSTATTRTLAVTIVSTGRWSRCGTQATMPPARREGPLAIPALFAPRGVAVWPGRRGWTDDSEELSAQLDTTMSVDAILTHYSAQLTAAGWKAVRAPSVADGVAVQQLGTRDASRAEWRGALLVVTVADKRDVLLRMARPAPE